MTNPVTVPQPSLDDPLWVGGKLTTKGRVNFRPRPDTSATPVTLLEGIYDGGVKRYPTVIPADGYNWHLYYVQGKQLWAADNFIDWVGYPPPPPPAEPEKEYYFDLLGRTYVIKEETKVTLKIILEYIIESLDKAQRKS
jgi:hypothetical protein